jgi:hypothetical protein
VATTWISCEDKRILYTDFRDCDTEEEMAEVFEKAVQIVLAAPEPVLTMNNFEGVTVPGSFVRKMRIRGGDYQHKAKAVLGVTGIKKTLLNTYSVLTGIDARAFATEAEAIAYLVSK